MDASRFPITTGYGQVPGYPLNNGWHRGEDRAMPMDTPVLVNGREIGLSGNSGQVTGPHLHIGRFVGGGDTAPNGGGFNFNNAVVTEVSEDPVNGKFVRVQADGASWVYLHLSRQSVSVGKTLVRPAVANPIPSAPPYTVIETYPNGRQVQLNKQPTNLWGMNFHFDFMKDHPVEVHNQGEVWTVTNKVHHEDGYDYYRRDGQVDGFNVLDCDDYVAVAPPPPPYVPPAAPASYKLPETYTLVTTVMAFEDETSAIRHKGLATPLDPGEYYVFKRTDKAINLSTHNVRDQNHWINISDNVVVPEPVLEVKPVVEPVKVIELPPAPKPELIPAFDMKPEPVKLDWSNKLSFLNTDRSPEYYHSINSMPMQIKDMSGTGKTDMLPAYYKRIPIVATAQIDNILYGLPLKSYVEGKAYFVPMRVLRLNKIDRFIKVVNNIRLSDKLTEAQERIKLVMQGINPRRKD